MIRKNLRGLTLPMGLLMLAMLLGGCNTLEGLGDDTAAAGDEIEEATDEATDDDEEVLD